MTPVEITVDPMTILLAVMFLAQWVRSERRVPSRDEVARLLREETEPSQQLVKGLAKLARTARESEQD